MKAFRVHSLTNSALSQMKEEELSPGEVLIDVRYSSLNYKDALAVTGRGKILRHFPLNAGIDAAGYVVQSQDKRWQAGQAVVVTGCGLGEHHDGGYAERIRVPSDWVVPLPQGLTPRQAMIFGTAGFTAGMCVHRMLCNDQTPDKGPIVVTGASGGVGSLAVAMFTKLGFDVIAVSAKEELSGQLMKIGAKDVVHPDRLMLGQRPLESARFGGAVDNVGGRLLQGLIPHINLWGNIASVGLAGGPDLHATVMPFILRGVSLLGISSANCPYALRHEIWQKLSDAWRPKNLEEFVSQEIGLDEVKAAATDMLDRKTSGRYVVKI